MCKVKHTEAIHCSAQLSLITSQVFHCGSPEATDFHRLLGTMSCASRPLGVSGSQAPFAKYGRLGPVRRVKHGGGKIFTFTHGILLAASQNSTRGDWCNWDRAVTRISSLTDSILQCDLNIDPSDPDEMESQP